MKLYITILAAFCALHLSAQSNTEPSAGGFVLLKGHIANNPDTALDYFHEGYVSYGWQSIRIDKNGFFQEKISVEQETDELGLRLGEEGVELSIQKNDTIELDWDAKDVSGTLALKSPIKWRERELRTQFSLRTKYLPAFRAMVQSLYKEKLSDSAKYARINGLYDQEMGEMLADSVLTRNTEDLVMNIYYRYAGELWSQRLIPAYDLTLLHPSANSGKISFFRMNTFSGGKLYQLESEEAFKNCQNYRNFLYDYVRFYTPLISWNVMGAGEEAAKKVIAPSSAWNDYYAGLRSFHVREIRDWFISKCIIDGFQFYPYEEVKAVYQDFMSRDPGPSPVYARRLKDAYAEIQHLRPGSPAPVFVLKDQQGQQVRLSDFRGKTVFIDFWGVHCAPCIYDIKAHAPALHEKYKDKNIVFINICVDVPEKEWKNNLDTLHLSGINLLAAGSIKDPVCKAYNINGIPHYYLIGKDGKIIDNNSPSPSQKSDLYEELDRSLK